MLDYSKPIKIKTSRDVETFETIIRRPPLHSVVVEIGPQAAAKILKDHNTCNRRMKRHNVASLSSAVGADDFVLTGDTIKVSKSGRLLDGQHRRRACVDTGYVLRTHVVFGLPDDVFDVLDQGAKRTAADVLRMTGVPDATWMASAVRWSIALDRNTIPRRLTTSSREILTLLRTKYKDLANYLPEARRLYMGLDDSHSPAFLVALLRRISRHDPALAGRFVDAWVSKDREGRNESFRVFSLRLMSHAKQNGGTADPYVRAAFTVQLFNAWNAGVVLTPRALSWLPHQKFPALEFDGKAYRKRREIDVPGLSDKQRAVLLAMSGDANGHKKVRVSVSHIATKSGVPRGSIHHILKSLENSEMISLVEHATQTEPAMYKILGAPEA